MHARNVTSVEPNAQHNARPMSDFSNTFYKEIDPCFDNACIGAHTVEHEAAWAPRPIGSE